MSSVLHWLEKESTLWVERGWMTEESVRELRAHYRREEGGGQSRMLGIFAVLGGLLISLGIVLLFAHNWDELSNHARAGIALGFLFLSQALATYALLRKPHEIAWTSAASLVQFIAVGGAIALVSQTYHIPGSLHGFYKTWLLMGVPLLYLFRNPLCGVAYYILFVLWSFQVHDEAFSALWLWFLALAPIPYLLPFYGKGAKTAMDSLLLWSFGIATPWALAIGFHTHGTFFQVFLGLAGMAGLFYYLGCQTDEEDTPLAKRPLRFLGGVILVGIGLTFGFEDIWDDSYELFESSSAISFLVVGSIFSLFVGLRGLHYFKSDLHHRGILHLMPIFFVGLAVLGHFQAAAAVCVILSSLVILALGTSATAIGIRGGNLGRANLGMLCIISIIGLRFADEEWTFVERGVGFIVLGTFFLAANIALLKKQKREKLHE